MTRYQQERYERLMLQSDFQELEAAQKRLMKIMDSCGLPSMDFESRVAYAAGYYKSVQESRKQ